MTRSFDVIIIGGGVIGCSIAYQLTRRGQKVLVLERGRIGAEASSAAAGMLAAQAELSEVGPLFELMCQSRALFPRLGEELRELTGLDIGLVREGLLHVAWTEEQERMLKAKAIRQQEVCEHSEWIQGDEARRMEPLLNEELRGALYISGDGQVQAPVLAAALAKAAAVLGAELHEYAEVSELLFEQGRVVGVQTAAGRFNGDHVVIAAGVWSGRLMKELGLDGSFYPVKGECFSVTTGKPLIRKTIFSESCYLVPKAGGRLIVGATVHPYSYDRKVSLGGLAYLMEQAQRLVPAIAEAEWEQCWSGLRPQTGDGRPYIGKVEGYGELYLAAGHYRNGILLSPITGIVIADLITGEGHKWHPIYSPNRMQKRGELLKREELSSVEAYN